MNKLKIREVDGKEIIEYISPIQSHDFTDMKESLQESYKSQNAKATKKILNQNATHMSKIHIAKKVTEQTIKDLFEAKEVFNYTAGAQAFLMLDPLAGTTSMDYQLITLRADGVVNTYTIPWYIFKVCYNSLNRRKIHKAECDINDKYMMNVIETLEMTYDKDGDTLKNIKLPRFGDVFKVGGDIESILTLETISFKKNKKLSSYSKFVYNGIDTKSFDTVSTVYFTDTLINACSLTYEHIQKILKEQITKNKTKKAEK